MKPASIIPAPDKTVRIPDMPAQTPAGSADIAKTPALPRSSVHVLPGGLPRPAARLTQAAGGRMR
ncbi:hypothetical protein V6667_09155 [Neisseria leonii]|nr:hypothetical protein [Neisseria sp. 3986]MDD9325732.1 hypothetical protein [Neisseria sp. 3986]